MEGIPGWGGSQERPGVREAPQAAASELGALHHGALTGRAQQKREIVALAFRQTGDSGWWGEGWISGRTLKWRQGPRCLRCGAEEAMRDGSQALA